MPVANITDKPVVPTRMHTPDGLAKLFDVSTQTIHRMERAGGLPKAVVLNTGRGQLLRWPAQAISDFIDGRWRPETTA